MLVWSVFFTKIIPKCLFVIIIMYAYLIDISQGSVEMHWKLSAECASEKILKIDQ